MGTKHQSEEKKRGGGMWTNRDRETDERKTSYTAPKGEEKMETRRKRVVFSWKRRRRIR